MLAAKFLAPKAFTLKAAELSVSAASTSVQAAAFTTILGLIFFNTLLTCVEFVISKSLESGAKKSIFLYW